jgi:hypothetical protein
MTKKKFPFIVSSRKYLLLIAIFTLAGVAGGYAYYYYIGCQTGSCGITSNPYLSILWGGALGYLVPDILVRKQTPED